MVPKMSRELKMMIKMIGMSSFLEMCGSRNGGRQKISATAKHTIMIVAIAVSCSLNPIDFSLCL